MYLITPVAVGFAHFSSVFAADSPEEQKLREVLAKDVLLDESDTVVPSHNIWLYRPFKHLQSTIYSIWSLVFNSPLSGCFGPVENPLSDCFTGFAFGDEVVRKYYSTLIVFLQQLPAGHIFRHSLEQHNIVGIGTSARAMCIILDKLPPSLWGRTYRNERTSCIIRVLEYNFMRLCLFVSQQNLALSVRSLFIICGAQLPQPGTAPDGSVIPVKATLRFFLSTENEEYNVADVVVPLHLFLSINEWRSLSLCNKVTAMAIWPIMTPYLVRYARYGVHVLSELCNELSVSCLRYTIGLPPELNTVYTHLTALWQRVSAENRFATPLDTRAAFCPKELGSASHLPFQLNVR